MARSTVNRTNPGSGVAHVVFTDASGGNREGVVLAMDGVDAALPASATFGQFVIVAGQQPAATTGAITTAATTVACTVTSYGNLTIGIFGTHAGVNVTFEASPDGGTTYMPIQVQREADGAVVAATGVLATNSATLYSTSAPGFTHIRVRATAWASGSATVVMAPGGMPFEPVVSAVTTPVVGAPARANVAASASSVTLRAANTLRKGLMIANLGTSNLYVDLTGGTATTTTAHSFPLPPNAVWEMGPMTYTTGLVTGIWTATGGSGANVTEF